MWMMGYNDGGDFNIPDSFNGRKLRPLIPRPTTATSTNNNAATPTPCLSRIHGADLFAINHHLASVAAEQSKREFNTQSVVVSSRWNPTPEQLRTLEDLYRRGTRTPSAEQIQHITAQLRRYGKIEGKNVFYWFQNHKARERQKRRRQLESAVSDEQHRDFECVERKESGGSRTGFEVEQTKNWVPPTHCSTLAEESISIQRAAKAAAVAAAECRSTDGWIQFDDEELQQRRSLVERNATWQMMHLSRSPPNPLINTTPATTTSATAAIRRMDPTKLIKTHDLNFFIAPYRNGLNNHITNIGTNLLNEESEGYGESQTLQLFPLRSNENDDESMIEKESEISIAASAMNTNFTTSANNYQYFEFLPLKN